MSTKTLMTVEQFAQLKTAETEDYELVEGELIPLASATPLHARIRRGVERLVEECFERNPIGEAFGEIDCRLSEDVVRRPDLSIFLGARLQQIDLNRIPAPIPPDIAVEVLSPSESAVVIRRKVREYLRAGTQEVWLLDPANNEVSVYTHDRIRDLQETDVLESPLLPGFSTRVADLLRKA